MGEINEQFEIVYEGGVPVPNTRQWAMVDNAIKKLVMSEDFEVPLISTDYLDKAQPFADTLGPVASARFLKLFEDRTLLVQVVKDEAQAFVDGFTDEEYVKHGGYGSASTHKATTLRAAMGNAPWNVNKNNKILVEAIAFAEARLPAFISDPWNSEIELDRPGPAELWKAYGESSDLYGKRTKLARNAIAMRKVFSQSMSLINENIVTSDYLFARRFNLMWELVELQAKHEKRAAVLTKPLEDYASWYVTKRYRKDNWNVEYKHTGAQAVHVIQQDIKAREGDLERVDTFINDHNHSWDIETLLADVAGALTNFELALRIMRQAELARQGKSVAQLKKKSDREKKQRKLAAKPVKVSAVITDSGTWINHLELRRGLNGRHNWLKLGDTTIHITRFRQWLDIVLRGIETNRRVRDLDQNEWFQFEDGLYRQTARKDAIRLFTNSGIQITAHFYDCSEEVAAQHDPIVHAVQFVKVKDEMHMTVWTPEDIATHKPALATA